MELLSDGVGVPGRPRPSANVTRLTLNRDGGGHAAISSIQTAPVNHSAAPRRVAAGFGIHDFHGDSSCQGYYAYRCPGGDPVGCGGGAISRAPP